MPKRRGSWPAAALALFAASSALAASPRPLELRRVDLPLPGPPSAIVPADLDRDGRVDLVIVTASTSWGSISQSRIEDAIDVTEVVPALFDKREARAFIAQSDGTYRAGATLALPATVIAVGAGTKRYPVLALTDDGVAAVTLGAGEGGGALVLEPILAEPSAFAESESFLGSVDFVRDVDGDGRPDAVLPTPSGLAIHPGTEDGGFAAEASYRGVVPGEGYLSGPYAARHVVRTPDFFDVDGDGKPDLVIRALADAPQRIGIARGEGHGKFGKAVWITTGCLTKNGPPKEPPAEAANDDENGPPIEPLRVAWFGDLDGDGRAEIVTREGIDTGKSDMKQTKKPSMRYRVFRLRPDLTPEPTPATTFEALGYAFSGSFQDGVDLEFLDLDGDKRKDLVTVTLDFSIFQALRALTSKKIGIGLEFHVIAQKPDGTFALVPDQTLDEKLNLDLNRLEISRLGQFRGDFDGDGRLDFVHLGRGKSVTIHRGQPGGRYPEKPDLAIALDEEPEDVMLVRVVDLDGDGRSDLAITRTLPAPEAQVTAPVRLELRLSGVVK